MAPSPPGGGPGRGRGRLSFVGLLKESELTEEQNLFTDRIQRSSEKLRGIIEDVLLIVKGEMGLIPVKYSNLNAGWLIKNIVPEVQQSMKDKQQTLKFNTNLDNIELDIRLTQMAFTRALHNATKFGLAGSEIVVLIYNDSYHKLIISIENKGPRISDSIIENIMKPFQMDENIMNHSVGMGLGLSICNTLLACQQASLKVQNTADGVVVFFRFRD